MLRVHTSLWAKEVKAWMSTDMDERLLNKSLPGCVPERNNFFGSGWGITGKV
jgi:hypothetical protein